ncbi:putative aminoglycoside phosphotransferase [Legionella busanensis]|uniref:Putative aminoglycoside phosphotransferase n=1 Tax=Legionella busanensis TaxID=190655 RepID=A0A378JJU0_9GAMM|nr:aminoglycoside phosphotransferase family protein [Legionella busanensis]STX51011.1 putative aminoglycoside phosphotransferase [Legionella busanensis]
MLTAEDIQHINHFFNLSLLNNINKLSGGDVNESYLATDGVNQYIIKKIYESEHAKDYDIALDKIIESITFSENIAQQLLYTNHVAPAVFTQGKCVLKKGKNLFIVFPFIQGSVRENEEVSLNMVEKIAKFLAIIHRSSFSFDSQFAEEKMAIFKKIGHQIIALKFWGLIKAITQRRFFFPKLNFISTYLINNKNTLHQAMDNLKYEAICHNDLKPKNVLWQDEHNFGVIDWETTGFFDLNADYLDTLIAWCTLYNKNQIVLDLQKLKIFISTYPLKEINQLEKSMPVVLLKWYFWLAFCIKKIISNPKQWRHYQWHIYYSITLIIFLIEGDLVKQLKLHYPLKEFNE